LDLVQHSNSGKQRMRKEVDSEKSKENLQDQYLHSNVHHVDHTKGPLIAYANKKHCAFQAYPNWE